MLLPVVELCGDWDAVYFRASLVAHAAWLVAGACRTDLALLPALPMLTHVFLLFPAIHVYSNMGVEGVQRVLCWVIAICSVCVASCAALLTTIAGWRTGHHAVQCAGVNILLWEKALWFWLRDASIPATRDLQPYLEPAQGRNDDSGSVRSDTKLIR